jgi:hypothetical protein
MTSIIYKNYVPTFLEKPPNIIFDFLRDIKNESEPLLRQLERFALLTRLFPFLRSPHPASVVETGVRLLHTYLKKHKELHKSFVGFFRDVVVENMEVRI